MVKIHKLMVYFLSCLVLLAFSCNQTNGRQTGKENDKPNKPKDDPPLVLQTLKIADKYVDIDLMKCEVKVEVTSDEIVATFDYGDEEDEAILVKVEGDVFIAEEGKEKPMYLSVPAVKGLHAGWHGTVTVTVEKIAMPIKVGYNGTEVLNGKEEEIDIESVDISVTSKEDVIKEVIINDGKKDHSVQIKHNSETALQDEEWQASKVFLLDTKDFTTYTITIKPKNENLFLQTTYTYKLKGSKIDETNAEFDYVQEEEGPAPHVLCDIEWVKGCESLTYVDYGARSLKMTARTVSPRASVYVKKVSPIDNKEEVLEGESEIKLKNDLSFHTGTIELFKDKPTKLIAYVVAEDGSTKNNEKGKWQMVFNPVDLFFDYTEEKLATEALRKTATATYKTIEIEKNKIQGNKFFIAFAIWEEKLGFDVGQSVKEMIDYKKLDTFGIADYAQYTAYQISVNTEDLKKGGSKEISIPVMRIKDIEDETLDEPIEAFTYKITILAK